MKYDTYECSGVLDGWKIITEEVKARTPKEAKSRYRRRYGRGMQDIKARFLRKGEQ